MRAAFVRLGLAVLVVASALVPMRPSSALDGPNITIGSVTVDEGDVGAAVVSIPVDLSTPSASSVTVHYTVVGDPTGAGAVAGETGKLTFAVGVVEKLIKVMVNGDTNVERDGDAQIVLSAPVNAQIADGVGDVHVRDDDTNPTSNTVSIGDATVIEADSGTHYAYVPVTLSAPATTTVKVNVLATCGSSTDPAPAHQTVTFQVGQRAKMLRDKIVADTTPENTEIAYKYIESGSTVIRSGRSAITIDDNDGTPPAPPPPPPLGPTEVVSQSTDGQLATYPSGPTPCTDGENAPSNPNAISADGRYVVFNSGATNLVPGDTNYKEDTFLRDRLTGTTERVDVTNDGSQLSDGSGASAFVSDDGRFVTFESPSPEVVPPFGQGVFVRDRTAGTTTEVSVFPDGSLASRAVVSGMSGDGRYVAFVAGDPTGESQGGLLYVRDLQTNSTKVITPETINNGWEWTPFTDNGQIAFVSSESTLVPGDTNGYPDVFVEDLATGAIDRVNLTPSGEQESGNSIGNVNASRIAISRDGRYVAFWSASANMGVAPNNTAIFLRDRVAGTTELASVLPFSYPFCFGEGIQGVSNDGRYVSFNEDCEPDDGINNPAIYGTFVRDRTLGTTTQVDTLPDGMPTNGFSYVSVMSADGNWIAYESDATNLLTNDTNNTADMFMHKLG